MSGRVKVVLADGRRVTGFRKTLAQRIRSVVDVRADHTVALVLTDGHSVKPGENFGITGVTTNTFGRVSCTGKSKDWVLTQMRSFLKRLGIDRHSAVLKRHDMPLQRGYERVVWITVSPSPGSYTERNEQGLTSMRTLPLFPEQ
jgi:hypothetical protein